MYSQLTDAMARLPKEYAHDLLPVIRKEFVRAGKTVVVLDDDPTGTQTCHDVVVLTAWTVRLIAEELRKKPSILFILTNSRSLPAKEAAALASEIGHNLRKAVRDSGQQIVAISRSDSTLRGHFPVEVDALAAALGLENAARIIIPAFIEGGRITIEDVHYIVEQHELVPVSATAFARDAAFGYVHSNLKEWVEEKTKGGILAKDVHSISLDTIRRNGPEGVSNILMQVASREVCIVNACSYRDLEVVAMGILLAEHSGKQFLYRTSASFVSIRAGIAAGNIFKPGKQFNSFVGSLVVVGSYVPKTTLQLERLLANQSHVSLEIDVAKLLVSASLEEAIAIGRQVDEWIASGKDVVLYTSRQLVSGSDPETSLHINQVVSGFLVSVVKSLSIRPSFLVAKGGITSSDLASKGLLAERALILGQAIPGVPVWQLDEQSKFPGLLYVVFPGNVGDAAALTDVCEAFITMRKS